MLGAHGVTHRIRSFLHTPKQVQHGSHDGEGPVDVFEIWGRGDFKSNVDFMDRVVIPPKSSVGHHQHGNNEEMYIVLEGRGTMTIDDEVVVVKKGDMILNPAYGEHGLTNDSDSNIDLLVIQIGLAD